MIIVPPLQHNTLGLQSRVTNSRVFNEKQRNNYIVVLNLRHSSMYIMNLIPNSSTFSFKLIHCIVDLLTNALMVCMYQKSTLVLII